MGKVLKKVVEVTPRSGDGWKGCRFLGWSPERRAAEDASQQSGCVSWENGSPILVWEPRGALTRHSLFSRAGGDRCLGGFAQPGLRGRRRVAVPRGSAAERWVERS